MIFVDTGGWFALTVPLDPNHHAAFEWLKNNREILFTTDYIVDETLTLLRARGEYLRALTIGRSFFDGAVAVVYRLTKADLENSWNIFRKYQDKDWSFTDCTSKAVMENMRITTAFTFDHHFKQFGTALVIP